MSQAAIVNQRTLRDLEFERVIDEIRRRAASRLGRSTIDALAPTNDLAAIRRELARVREMIEAVEDKALSLGPMEDLKPLLERARETTSLGGEEFLSILRTLESARRLKSAIGSLEGDYYEEMPKLAERIGIFRELEGAIRRSFDEDGELRETASPQLRRLTRRKRLVEERVESRLRDFLNAPEHSGLVREPLITRRSSRLVVPIKSHSKRELDCVVHDSSDSGQTLYVEPRSVVEDNNEIRELESEIRDEKLRILRELTTKVQAESRAIGETLAALATLDGLYARARYALDRDCAIPELTARGRIRLRGARHPLLDPETVVPVDLSFGDRHLGVLITGPNTGGKTVTLKTVGLLTLMAQSGIPIPADPESELSVFGKIRSDIGDEQSIQQNLSTFSSHMKNLVGILGEIDSDSLVLIDELGAGTDPQEGAALGIGILERLLEIGARLLVTTHFSALKHFAYKHPALTTCSVEFDVQTLRPTYRLLEGVGSSNAFIIAERLGLSPDIVSDAKGSLSEGAVKAEEIIRLLERERIALSQERSHLEREREQARREEEQYKRRLEALEAGKEAALRAELKELEGHLHKTRRELERALHRIHQQADEAGLKEELKRLESAREGLQTAAERAFASEQARLSPDALHEGMRVRVRPLDQVGVIREIGGERRIEVDVEGMRVEVELDDVEAVPVERHKLREERKPRSRRVEGRHEFSPAGPALELNVRGLTASEALREVDLYIDRLMLNDVYRARIIHGKGTGTLRREIRAHLSADPRVARCYPAPAREGGDGATIVELEM